MPKLNAGLTMVSGKKFVFLFIGFTFLSCKAPSQSAGQPNKPASPPISAVIEMARKGDIKVIVTGIGTVTPLNYVTVKSRVNGELMSIHFKEGQTVSKGGLLATIDPGPYEAQLTQAAGQLERDGALLENARHDLSRYDTLWDQNAIPRQQFETQKSLVLQLEGTVKIDQGLLENAKLQLAYTQITSPINGRVGLKLVDPGNIVQTTDGGGLAVVTQLQPITVVFSVPEDDLPRVLGQFAKSESLSVEAYNRSDKVKLADGILLAVDNRIDTSTGTVRLKAVFPNASNELFPNQFVNVRLLLEVRHNAVLIPQAAVQTGQKGTYVYRVKRDHTVVAVPVTVGLTEEDSVSIVSGLSAGDSVVVEGADRLRDGSVVESNALAAHAKL